MKCQDCKRKKATHYIEGAKLCEACAMKEAANLRDLGIRPGILKAGILVESEVCHV
jgi:hypothetical protein